ncbi:MAG: hypothetical protein WC565_09785 [Parcubacteria group bacterium]
MNVAEWVLLGIGVAALLLGIGRAIYVAGIHKGIGIERERAMRVGVALRTMQRIERN